MAENEKTDGNDTVWAISNRQDDRVVLFERDERHPGGEAFIGGSTPDEVFKTDAIERLLHEGLIVEIPEPPDKVDGKPNRKKPISFSAVEGGVPSSQPGQPIKLGRRFDGDIVPVAAQKKVQERQSALPSLIKSRAEVPPRPNSPKETARS